MKIEELLTKSGARIDHNANHVGDAIQKPQELQWLIDRLPAQREHMLEIGFHRGGTFLLWRQLYNRVTAIEKDAHLFKQFGAVRADVFADERYRFLVGNSQEPHVVAAAKRLAPFDALFIDGSHKIEHCKADYLNYAPLVRKGGCIIFHDVAHTHPDCGVYLLLLWLRDGSLDGKKHNVERYCCDADIWDVTTWSVSTFGVGLEIVR